MKTILSFLDQTLSSQEIKEVILKQVDKKGEQRKKSVELEKEIFRMVHDEAIQKELQVIVQDVENRKKYTEEIIEDFSKMKEDKDYAGGFAFENEKSQGAYKDYLECYAKGFLLAILLANISDNLNGDHEKVNLVGFVTFLSKKNNTFPVDHFMSFSKWLYFNIKGFLDEKNVRELHTSNFLNYFSDYYPNKLQ